MAPEPAWEPRPFDRERFLLFLLAGVVAAQYLFLLYGSGVCTSMIEGRARRGQPPLPQESRESCIAIGDRLATVFDLSVATILALLAGQAVGASRSVTPPPPSHRRRHPPETRH